MSGETVSLDDELSIPCEREDYPREDVGSMCPGCRRWDERRQAVENFLLRALPVVFCMVAGGLVVFTLQLDVGFLSTMTGLAVAGVAAGMGWAFGEVST